jgi:hypothetical protein
LVGGRGGVGSAAQVSSGNWSRLVPDFLITTIPATK